MCAEDDEIAVPRHNDRGHSDRVGCVALVA